MKPKYRTQNNYKHLATDWEKVDPISQTIQGEAFNIKEILERFTRDLLPAMERPAYYHDTDDIDYEDVAMRPNLDLTEALEARNEILSKVRKNKITKIQENSTPLPPDLEPETGK